MSAKTEKTAEAAAETSVKSVSASEGKKQGNVMYLGPTITGKVRHSTVFKDGVLPGKVNELVKQLPMMERLFVPVASLPAAIKELNKKQSVLGTIYSQTTSKFVK